MRLCLIILIFFYETVTLAAGEGIPWPTIAAQTFNVIVGIFILIYLLKDTVRSLFTGRVEKFDEDFKKAQEQKKIAIASRDEIKKRLEDLKINAEKSIEEAKMNAKKKTGQMLLNSEEQAQKMLADSQNKVLNEKNQMVNMLKKELLVKAFDKARDGLSESMSKPELEKLNNEFIKNIQAVQQ